MSDCVTVSAVPVSFRDDDLSTDEVVRRYRTLIEQLPLVVYIDELDSISSNIFTNGQIEPMLGYSVEEWATDPELFSRLLHPDDRERVLAAHVHTHETHEPLSLEYRLIARDGRTVHLRYEGVIVLDDHGQPRFSRAISSTSRASAKQSSSCGNLALYDPLTGLAKTLLTLELTESTLLASDDRVARTLERIKELGVVLALDDFGTGYASLSYLRQFPIDVVKIDRSFTAHAESENGDLVLLKGIIDLGHALELNLVAEGIETPEQHTIVHQLGCHQAQGFYFGRPSHPAQHELDL